MMKKTIFSTLAVVSVLFLASCSTYQYYPYSGETVVYEGKGGAMEVVDGVEIWIKGAPNKRFTVLGYIDGRYTDEWFAEESLKKSIAQKIREINADAAILNQRRTRSGDAIDIGYSVVIETDVFDEYWLIKYTD